MMGVELPQEQEQRELPNDTCHLFCETCYPNEAGRVIALCGHDCTDEPYTPNAPEETECVMCVEIDKAQGTYCPKCGQ